MASSSTLFTCFFILFLSLKVTSCLADSSAACYNHELKGYINCLPLPTFNSTLYFTYNRPNSTLSLLFTAVPPTLDGWIAWGINPSRLEIIGSELIAAFKEHHGMVVKTFYLESYQRIVPQKLSFNVWNLKAEQHDEGLISIYATLKVPDHADVINHIWQVGDTVKDGMIFQHDINQTNLDSKGKLDLIGSCAARRKAKNFHEVMNIVAWGILNPIGLIAHRHVDVYPALLHVHVYSHLIASFIGVGGGIIGMLKGFKSKTQYTNHGIFGIILMCLVVIQAVVSYLKGNEHKYEDRSRLKIYHYISGYIVTIFGAINVLLGFELSPEAEWKSIYPEVLGALCLIGLALELPAWCNRPRNNR